MSNNLQFFQGFTLVDITNTGVVRESPDRMGQRNQQRNWETVIQCMSLRTQPQNIVAPVCELVPLEYYEFGDFYSGQHLVWTWSWSIEREEIFDLPGRPMAGLLQDFEQVPIVTGLEETARFMLPIFYPYGTIKNIYFKPVSYIDK